MAEPMDLSDEALAELAKDLMSDDERLQEATKLLEFAWGVIANAGYGDWTREAQDWQRAAVRWRDQWNAWLKHE